MGHRRPDVLLVGHTVTEWLQLLSQKTFLLEIHIRECGLKHHSTEEEAEAERDCLPAVSEPILSGPLRRHQPSSRRPPPLP